MDFTIEFHPEAITELEEAISWYHAQNNEVAQDFFDIYRNLEKRIQENPLLFPMVLEEVRRANFRKFPYSIYFSVDNQIVVIYAVFNNSRNPNVWKERL